MLTGNKDTEYIVLSNLDDISLFNYCQTDKSAKKICSNDSFWKSRFIEKIGKNFLKYKPGKKTWKNFYLDIFHFIYKTFIEWNSIHNMYDFDWMINIKDYIDEITSFDEDQYIGFLKIIFKLSLDKPDIFNFFENFLPKRIVPVFLERENALLLKEKIKLPDLSPIKLALTQYVSSMKILKNVLEQLDLNVNEIKIIYDYDLSYEKMRYLKNSHVLEYLRKIENDSNFLNENYKKF